jgi:hypothetical protein
MCPECGAHLYRNISGVIRTSAVLISADGEDRFFHSVQEVPERLRKRLMDSTAGDNSGTIVIADRAGKQQLTQALARRESARRQSTPALNDLSLPETQMEPVEPPKEARHAAIAHLPWIAWVGFFLVLAAAAGVSAFFGTRW